MNIQNVIIGNTLQNNGYTYTVEPDFYVNKELQSLLTPVELTPKILSEFGMIQPESQQFWIHNESLQTWKHNKHATFRFGFVESENTYSVSIGDDQTGFIFTRIKYLHELEQFWIINNK